MLKCLKFKALVRVFQGCSVFESFFCMSLIAATRSEGGLVFHGPAAQIKNLSKICLQCSKTLKLTLLQTLEYFSDAGYLG